VYVESVPSFKYEGPVLVYVGNTALPAFPSRVRVPFVPLPYKSLNVGAPCPVYEEVLLASQFKIKPEASNVLALDLLNPVPGPKTGTPNVWIKVRKITATRFFTIRSRENTLMRSDCSV
jgi:hypothetical protein